MKTVWTLNRWSREEWPFYFRTAWANDIVLCGWRTVKKGVQLRWKICEANSVKVGWILTIEDLEWQTKEFAFSFYSILSHWRLFRFPMPTCVLSVTYAYQCLLFVLECRPRESTKISQLNEFRIPWQQETTMKLLFPNLKPW